MIAVSVLVTGIQEYLLTTGYYNSINGFQQFDLVAGIADLLLGFGVIVAGIGWILDRRMIDGARGLSSLPELRFRAMLGHFIIALGAVVLAFVALFWAYLELCVYYTISITWLPDWTLAALELVAGVGILVLAIGWMVHHSAVLTWTERHPG
jgi:hypothetical protein